MYFTCQQSNAQNSPSQASTVHQQRTPRCSRWIQKEEEPKIKLPRSVGSQTKQEKNTYFCFSGYAKAFDCVDHNKLWKILKEIGIPDPLPYLPPEKPVCRSRSNSQNWTWNNGLVPNWNWTIYIKTLYCHSAYLTYTQSTS